MNKVAGRIQLDSRGLMLALEICDVLGILGVVFSNVFETDLFGLLGALGVFVCAEFKDIGFGEVELYVLRLVGWVMLLVRSVSLLDA